MKNIIFPKKVKIMTTNDVLRLVRGLIKDTLRTDGQKAYEYIDDNTFTLPEPFVDSSSIQVYQNSNLLSTDDWSYNSSTNQVTISFQTSGLSLSSGDIILITFDYYGKYSDTELQYYLEAALVYFVQYRYDKVFEFNSNNEIVTVNGVNPTVSELQFIAIIAAISIDPDNIVIRTKEFTINGSTTKDKDTLIKDAFNNFTKNFGRLNFIEYDGNDCDCC